MLSSKQITVAVFAILCMLATGATARTKLGPLRTPRPGDRIFIAAGKRSVHDRAEVQSVSRDGSVTVRTWDVPPILQVRGQRGLVQRPGKPPIWKRAPWTSRLNERQLTISAKEVARLNSDPPRRYSIWGYVVDFRKDPVLRKQLGRAMKIASKLTNKTPPQGSWSKTQLARYQHRIIVRIWQDVRIDFPEGQDAAYLRWEQMLHKQEPNKPTFVGEILKHRAGECWDQAAVMAGLLTEVGRRYGFRARAAKSSTDAHGFVVVTLADGRSRILDPVQPSRLHRRHQLEDTDRGAYPRGRLQWYGRGIEQLEAKPL